MRKNTVSIGVSATSYKRTDTVPRRTALIPYAFSLRVFTKLIRSGMKLKYMVMLSSLCLILAATEPSHFG